jgi:hypothetical protein
MKKKTVADERAEDQQLVGGCFGRANSRSFENKIKSAAVLSVVSAPVCGVSDHHQIVQAAVGDRREADPSSLRSSG